MQAFLEESEHHGWPSFRDAEVVWENVLVKPGGETVSINGTHVCRAPHSRTTEPPADAPPPTYPPRPCAPDPRRPPRLCSLGTTCQTPPTDIVSTLCALRAMVLSGAEPNDTRLRFFATGLRPSPCKL
jgi:hypothetical protein